MAQKYNRLRFTRIRLKNWRNFTDVDCLLQKRVFLVGPNASGKSNFLDAFRFLRDLVLDGGGLQTAVQQKRGGMTHLRCLAARSNPAVEIEVALGDEREPQQWCYELAFTQSPGKRLMVKREAVFHEGKQLLERPNATDKKDSLQLTQTYLQSVNTNQDFRPIADFFRTVRYLHIVPQLIRESERWSGTVNDPFGGDFLQQVATTHAATQKARLKRIQQALCVAVPQLQQLELIDEKGKPHLVGKYAHWRRRPADQRETDFSDGTLRLIGLLWALLEDQGPLLLEEPELSLHPGIVLHLPQLIARMQRESGRQVLLSTHSVEMLQDEGIGLDEVFLFEPQKEGTTVSPASSIDHAADLLKGGLTLADLVIPRTRPPEIDQLPMFGN